VNEEEIQAQEFKDGFDRIMADVINDDQRYVITRDYIELAVILSYEDYCDLKGKAGENE
jgi:PHD/YefM family antitoxin component YafN of YafNO toxin-antitoxin module